MGRVWFGVHVSSRESVAVKVLDAARVHRESSVDAIRNEVRAMASLTHPNVIWVHDQGTIDRAAARTSGGQLREGAPWFAMELAEHGTLKDRFSFMDWPMLRRALSELLSALSHAHAHGVIHRDIKPANVLFAGANASLKLTDFGLVYALQRDAKPGTRSKAHGGTPAYMAPEQCLSQGADIGPWSDLYSVGCLAWRASCGLHPFRGKSVMKVIDGHVNKPIPRLKPRFPVPPGFEIWVRELMHKDPSWRFQWAAEARHELMALGEPIAESRPDDSEGNSPRPISSGGLTTILFDADAQRDPTTYDAPYPKPLDDRAPLPVPYDFEDAIHSHPETGLSLYGLREIPLVGRHAERHHLWDQLIEVHETGTPRAIVLRGAAGCGKSRLAEWVYRRSHEVGAATVFRALHNPEGGPGDGIVGMLNRGMSIAGLSRDRAVEQIARLLKRLGHFDDNEVNRLAELLSPASDANSTTGNARPVLFRSDAERHEVGRRFLSWMARRRPLVLWLDDVQWGLESIEFATRILKGDPFGVLIVLTVRDDELAERDLENQALLTLEALGGCSSLAIGPMKAATRIPLVQAILRVDRALAEQVAIRTDGNPLFAVHLLGDWVDRGALEYTNEGYRLVDGAVESLPDDLRAMWTARVARVIGDRGDRWLQPLEVAAVLGRVVDEDEWKMACTHAGVTPRMDAVGALLTERLAVRTDTGWAFAHGMLREAIAEHARLSGRWEQLHRACARMLLPRSGPGISARLGRHRLDAGDPAGALEPLLAGFQEHFVAGAYGLADRLLDTWSLALAQLDPPEADPRWGNGWMKRMYVQYSLGRFDEAGALNRKIVETSQRHGWVELEIRALVQLAKSQTAWGPETTETGGLQRALELAIGLNDRELMSVVRYQIGVEAANQGFNQTAREMLQEAVETYEAIGEDSRAMMGWIHIAHIEMQNAHYAQSLALLTRAEKRAQALGSAYGLSQVYAAIGEVSRLDGDLNSAEIYYERSYRIQRDIGNVSAQLARINVGLTRVERGDRESARMLLRETLTRTRKKLYIVAAHLGLLVCAAEDDDPDAWRESMDLLMEWGSHGRADIDFAHMSELAARTAVEAGYIDRAREAWGFAARQMHRLGRDRDVDRIGVALARLR